MSLSTHLADEVLDLLGCDMRHPTSAPDSSCAQLGQTLRDRQATSAVQQMSPEAQP